MSGERSKSLRLPPAEAPGSPAADASSPAPAAGAEPREAVQQLEDEDRGLSIEVLTDKYYKKIYNLILRTINDPEEAADLTQETFVNATRSYANFRGDCKVQTWLYQIAVNQCKNRFRQRDRRRSVEGPSLDEAMADNEDRNRKLEIADWDQSPQDVLLKKEEYLYVLRAINALQEDYRKVIVLCDLQHQSYADIAKITGLSLEAVKTRIHRGRLMLRRKLEAYLKS